MLCPPLDWQYAELSFGSSKQIIKKNNKKEIKKNQTKEWPCFLNSIFVY